MIPVGMPNAVKNKNSRVKATEFPFIKNDKALTIPSLVFLLPLPPGPEEGGVSPGALQPLQPHRPFPGSPEGL